MDKPKIQVILGSIREGRSGEKVAKWFMEQCKDFDKADLELVDVRDYQLPLFADPTPPSVRENEHANPQVQKWLNKLAEADGFIIITAEYDHSIPGALKNNIDYAFKEWAYKPVGLVGYGSLAGGSRAVEHLRQVAAEVNMFDVREQVLVPMVWQAFDDQNRLLNDQGQVQTAQTLLDKVARLAVLLRPMRNQ